MTNASFVPLSRHAFMDYPAVPADLANRLIQESGFEAALSGNPAQGKYLVPGTPLAGQHRAANYRDCSAE